MVVKHKSGSIDDKHNEKIMELERKCSTLSKLENKIKQLTIEKQKMTNIFDRLEFEEIIHNVKRKNDEIVNNTSSDYLLKVSPIFKEFSYENTPSVKEYDSPNYMNQFVERKTTNNRGKLFQKYMHVVNDQPLDIVHDIDDNETLTCPDCKYTMKLSVNESYTVCGNCGTLQTYFEPSIAGLTYEQEINTETNIHFAYKRINHLRELLAQLQAKETSDIPDDVLDKIRAEFKKARIQNTSEITQQRVKTYLKKLSLNKFYEHTRQITNMLNGKPPPIISNDVYETLINMFTDIQEPFEKVCPKNRKNFFSYNYILYKFCELIGETTLMMLFPLLKSREKLYQQDCIWKSICVITNWTFLKSV